MVRGVSKPRIQEKDGSLCPRDSMGGVLRLQDGAPSSKTADQRGMPQGSLLLESRSATSLLQVRPKEPEASQQNPSEGEVGTRQSQAGEHPSPPVAYRLFNRQVFLEGRPEPQTLSA